MELKEYPDAEMMMLDLADRLASELRTALTSHEHASLAVPGGTTPGPVFDSLCGADLDWDRVHVFLTDERWVPEDSPRSNTALVRRRLLTERAAAATYVPLYAGTETPEEALEQLEATFAPEMPISVLLLGMGADMHTASIFPGADRLDDALHGSALLVPMRAPGAAEPRITLSARALRDALSTHIVITGADKREALEKARRLTPEEAPVAAVLKGATVHWAES
ncbi:6-phosphogluconolactonase [Wenxinia marina]|uniref:6-phosphogluconolactonase n=1 Tax=Wenxinia marina DSM 24838 TaxID=1123501 RepID=A0A0D0Q9G6_9RHOB|nr:6-phosphogluconolactonase [Wenxinia marina]KIQ67678.1 6-phosphogluconolactonase [Wenxinia marina DSM 24838]GGL79819.1 6-phosphogluconolactonase [Wenxinia marina]